ncbi:DMT family transporter [Mangrovibacillus cuniculi]|uniref:Multidrug efflux SMR transporter n=1 Tax=Mangrovibacillus cuniculi TaxID=2593652 RepID=A0A7S8CDV6_9BACI|nr:multidrug efflux SMR transporter [Mangrovibacillus cuniculi]QPC48174.1 multidrug efflux SMR transporter [Mangrovibacillus cuniculi]
MAWFYLILGGIVEVVWATGLKLSEGFTRPGMTAVTLVAIIVSFYFFAKALKLLSIGTAYAVFTGIGAAGSAVVGILYFQESFSFFKLFFLLVLIAGIIGLKLVDGDKEEAKS